MILDLPRFVEKERPFWEELDRELDRMAQGLAPLKDITYSQKVLSLFHRACSDLARLGSSTAEPELYAYLESLVARGYAEIHAAQPRLRGFRPIHWFFQTLPQTFRRQLWAFKIALAVTVIGAVVGAILISVDPEAREVVYPFSHLSEQTPSQRVQKEESSYGIKKEMLENSKTTFSAQLMGNNIKVSINAMALGLTWGLGTIVLLFYNGVILGAVALDYIVDGQTVFMLGWLLPHGSIEIPAILIAGQAGLMLGRAVIGWGTREGVRTRLRLITPDLATLIGFVALMLVWAGFVEAFLSQYHEPVLPYWVKITFGSASLVTLFAFLFLSGTKTRSE